MKIASLIIIVVGVGAMLVSSPMRAALADFLKAFVHLLHWRILLLFAAYFGYASTIVYTAYRLGWWQPSMAKEAVVWVLFSGLPVLFRSATIKSGRLFLSRTIKEAFSASVFIAFYLNLSVFSLPVEILLQVVLLIAVLFELAARVTKPPHDPQAAKTIAAWIFGTAGLVLVVAATLHVVGNWEAISVGDTLKNLAMGIWFPIALIPFIYAVAVLMHIGQVLSTLKFLNGRKDPRLSVRIGFILGTHFRPRYASNLRQPWRGQVARAQSFGEVSDLMRAYRAHLRQDQIRITE